MGRLGGLGIPMNPPKGNSQNQRLRPRDGDKASDFPGSIEVDEAVAFGAIGQDRRDVRTVIDVRGDVAEEGLLRLLLFANPENGLVKVEVGAESLGLNHLAIVIEDGVVVVVVGEVGGVRVVLADPARSMDVHFVESTFVWAIGFLVAQMPFTEDAGGVAGVLEHARDGFRDLRLIRSRMLIVWVTPA